MCFVYVLVSIKNVVTGCKMLEHVYACNACMHICVHAYGSVYVCMRVRVCMQCVCACNAYV